MTPDIATKALSKGAVICRVGIYPVQEGEDVPLIERWVVVGGGRQMVTLHRLKKDGSHGSKRMVRRDQMGGFFLSPEEAIAHEIEQNQLAIQQLQSRINFKQSWVAKLQEM